MQTEVHGKTWWGNVARGLARDAWNNWESRRGTWHLEDVDKLCLYNNHPYARYPERRDEETAAFRRWLKANGIKELAYATYPETGVDAGATYAMIVDAGKDRLAEIRAELQRILLESNAADRMSATGP